MDKQQPGLTRRSFLWRLMVVPPMFGLTVVGGGKLNGFLAALMVAVLSYHSYLGTLEVVEDYVHGNAMKLSLLLSLRFIHVLLGGASLYAILRIALGIQAS